MSQRTRVLWVIVLAILPLVALSGFSLWQQLRRDEARIADDRLQLARAAAFAVQAFLDGQLANARTIALHPELARLEPSEPLNALLKRLAARHPEWEGLGVVGADGMRIAGSSGGAPLYLGDRAYFRRATETGRATVSDALIGRISGKTTVIIAAPIESPRGRGVLIVPLPTDRFGASLAGQIGTPPAALTVVDARGQAFIRPDPGEITGLERVRGPAVEAVLAGENGARTVVQGRGVPTLVAYAAVGGYGWGVLLSEPVASAHASARRQALERSAVLLAMLAVVVGIGWILAGRVALYFERAEGLSRELRRALETRDEFLAAAAHDLRNPLSTVQAAGEVLQRAARRPGSVAPAQLEKCATHILSATRRMSRMLAGFLDIAHLEIGRPLQLERRRTDLAALARQAVQECQETSARHRVSFEGPPALEAELDGARLQRALENLLANAVKYSPEGGDIRVRLQARGGEVLLAVEDRGIGIPAADLERVFGRFERGSNVAGRFSGTGIGLSAARHIVEQHGGSLTVISELGKGSIFTIHLGRSPVESAP